MFRRVFLPWFVWWTYWIWSRTWRVSVRELPSLQQKLAERKPLIFAHWHGDELAIIATVPRYRIATMTSTSSDGSLVDFVIKKLGGATSRGSSTRGGVRALVGLIKTIRSGEYCGSMAVDGPKGPIYKVKPGVFELSVKTDAEIVPTGVAISNPFVFKKSWNKAALPLPFSKIVIWFEPEWTPPTEDPRSETLPLLLEEDLIRARNNAAKELLNPEQSVSVKL